MSFPRYPKYKDSGVEWLGEVPEHWGLPKLRSVATFTGGGTPSREVPEFWGGDIPWVSPKDMKTERITGAEEMITQQGLQGSAAALLDPGHLLMVVRSGILKHTIPVALNSVSVALNQDMKALRFDRTRARADFFFRWVQGLNDRLLLAWAKQGATVESIEQSYLADTVLPLPPRKEQDAICSFLDRETAKIDELVAEQQRLMELLKEKRQAVISHAVTKGLNPAAPMKPSGVEWLGEVPAHWEVRAVKSLAASERGAFSDGDWIEAPFVTDNGVRLIQTGNIGIGRYKEQGFRYISADTFDQLKCTEVFPGDVLICRLDGPVGRGCLAPDLGIRMITSVDNAILKCGKDAVPSHVVALLSSAPWLAWIEAICRVGGGFRLRISRSQLGEILVPLPPLAEQLAITNRLTALVNRTDELLSGATLAISLLNERRSALISAAVTGQIDVRHLVQEAAA